MKNIIITLLVLLLSLTSCKEKEDMNKKYHWVAYVKPVAGLPYSNLSWGSIWKRWSARSF